MSAANEICRMDAITLAAQVRAKALSASEVTEAVLARMAVLEPQLHAFCTPTPDVAAAAPHSWGSGLHGFPLRTRGRSGKEI